MTTRHAPSAVLDEICDIMRRYSVDDLTLEEALATRAVLRAFADRMGRKQVGAPRLTLV